MPDSAASTARDDAIERTRRAPSLETLYAELARLDLTAGWLRRQRPILWREPKSVFPPAQWRYDESKAALDAAGRLIDVALAERRNLPLRAPVADNDFATLRTLVCAYQMILPGEKAPSHRHAPHALRVIIEAEGAYSIVEGEKTPMETGDVVLTPGWHWHSHGHDGDQPAYWFDGLDVPLTHLLEPMFYEEHPDSRAYEAAARPVTSSPFRFTRAWIARSLDAARPDAEGFHGRRITLPAPSMPTMGLAVERLDRGSRTRRYRSTANACLCVMEGSGSSTIAGKTMAWQRGDVFTVPCWSWQEHQADSDAMLFTMSDEPLMRFSAYWRFEAGA